MVVKWLREVDTTRDTHPTNLLLKDGWNMFVRLLRPSYKSGRTYEDDHDHG
jgi:hypothetical protein